MRAFPLVALAACALLLVTAAPPADARQACVSAIQTCAGDLTQCGASTQRASGVRMNNAAGLVYVSLTGYTVCSTGTTSVLLFYDIAGESVGSAVWGPSTSACRIIVDFPVVFYYTNQPCVAGPPPDPGWGHLLP